MALYFKMYLITWQQKESYNSHILSLLKQQNHIFSRHKKGYALALQDCNAHCFAEGFNKISVVEYSFLTTENEITHASEASES